MSTRQPWSLGFEKVPPGRFKSAGKAGRDFVGFSGL